MSNINTVNFNGTEYGIESASVEALKTYLTNVFNQLKAALNNNDTQSAIAILNQAVLDISQLA